MFDLSMPSSRQAAGHAGIPSQHLFVVSERLEFCCSIQILHSTPRNSRHSKSRPPEGPATPSEIHIVQYGTALWRAGLPQLPRSGLIPIVPPAILMPLLARSLSDALSRTRGSFCPTPLVDSMRVLCRAAHSSVHRTFSMLGHHSERQKQHHL